ncbi:MAG TPA: polynucleotide adenylyltransferase PcnB [Thermoanaerobaculia bacterium]
MSHDPEISSDAASTEPRPDEILEGEIIPRDRHCISRRDVPENVLKVLYRLHRSGRRAYLCGGSVRDLLLKRAPKDFDVATDAHPNEVRRLFRNSRIIGRRFRLVHILFQDRVVEVSTFRKEPENRPEDADLLVTDDNTFGTPREDARRRDFTINGLFYNIADFTIIDYVGGMHDIEQRCVRVIGEPDIRFREDPVRMMRAVEFASRLDFEIDASTYDAIIRHRTEIVKASPARVSEEILELLRRGWSAEAFELMVETHLLEPLFPELYQLIQKGNSDYFWKMLAVLDRTVRSGRRISDAVLLSVLLLPHVVEQIEKEEVYRGGRLRLSEALLFIRELIQPICQRFTLAAGTRHQIEQALETLWRLLDPPTERRSMWRFVFREPFNDAMALFELYALSSGRHVDAFRNWQQFAQRVKKSEGEPPKQPARRRRKRS